MATLGVILKFQEVSVRIVKIMLAKKNKKESSIPELILQEVGPLVWDSGWTGMQKKASFASETVYHWV